jgi:cellulose synthase/poly-beta-1,6-N-acetylglucosamine synthase-like glycosyltransferase
MPITEVAPTFWQIAIFVLIFFLILFAFGATYMIWEKAHLSSQTPHQQDDKASAKLKREQKERVRRLLEQMDSDDLAALETRLSDDGEIVSMEELLDQGEFQRRR